MKLHEINRNSKSSVRKIVEPYMKQNLPKLNRELQKSNELERIIDEMTD